MTRKIKFQLADGVCEYADDGTFKSSSVIQSILDEDAADEEEILIPFPEITVNNFMCIARFLQHHMDNPMAPMFYTRPPSDKWDQEFVASISSPQLLVIVENANYLGINELVHLLASTIAARVERKTKQEICEDFKIEAPTQEEIDAYIEKNKWEEFR